MASWRELVRKPRRKAQKLLSTRLDNKHYDLLLDSLDAPDAARLRSCGGPGAAAWQLACPGQRDELLDDREYALTARALLGQDLASTDHAFCRNRRRTGDRVGEAGGKCVFCCLRLDRLLADFVEPIVE